MIVILHRRFKLLSDRRWLRVLFQALVSLVLLGLLIVPALRHEVLNRLQALEVSAVALAIGFHFGGTVVNSLRW